MSSDNVSNYQKAERVFQKFISNGEKELTLLGYWGLEELPPLPPSIQTLSIYEGNLKKLPELPPSLESLYLRCVPLEELPELPPSLKKLKLLGTNFKIQSLPELPSSLVELEIFSNPNTSLPPSFPPSLRILRWNTNLSTFPPVPTSLGLLQLSTTESFITLPLLPLSLKFYHCTTCKRDTYLENGMEHTSSIKRTSKRKEGIECKNFVKENNKEILNRIRAKRSLSQAIRKINTEIHPDSTLIQMVISEIDGYLYE